MKIYGILDGSHTMRSTSMRIKKLDRDEIQILETILRDIKRELDRCYWNHNQKEMRSPFDNTGESYKNDVFAVYAYYWGDNDALADRPNFVYKDLKVYWYKYLGRCTAATMEKPLSIDYLKHMLNNCMEAIRRDFDEK